MTVASSPEDWNYWHYRADGFLPDMARMGASGASLQALRREER
jgi:hypothetical protein